MFLLGDCVVYTVPGCTGCDATKRWLDKRGVEFEVVDMSGNPDLRAKLSGEGFMSAPVVKVGGASWSGFRPDLLKKVFTA